MKTNPSKSPQPIPIPIPPSNQTHNRVVVLVKTILDLNRKFASATSQTQNTLIQRHIDATDAEIDRLVYDLYGLTKEEIAIVEGATA